MSCAVAPNLAADGERATVQQAGNPVLTQFVQQTDLDRGAFGNAEFVIRYGNTLPKRSSVALGFCGRQVLVAALATCTHDLIMHGMYLTMGVLVSHESWS